MASDPLCSHGNCGTESRHIVVSVNYKRGGAWSMADRKTFCSFDHAMKWLDGQKRNQPTEEVGACDCRECRP